VEEAEKVSQASWEVLIPTIRKVSSEIWISFNCKYPTDPTYTRFVQHQMPDSYVRKVSWRDNPWFPDVLEKERLHLLSIDPAAYAHIWEGEFDTRYFGGVYAKWVSEAQSKGRIIPFEPDPNTPVNTAWDLGYSDSTAIWWWQMVNGEVRVLDFYENSNEDIAHYCQVVLGKSYKNGLHFVPHDAANKLLQAGGRSAVEQMAAYLGGISKMRVVAATSQQNGIEAARLTLQSTWFNIDKCTKGIDALMNYQFLYDEDRKTYKNTPNHDWSSHAADAFEVIGQVWKTPDVTKPPPPPKFLEQATANDVFWGEANQTPYGGLY
jgi:phage terminase large subunit